MVINKWKYNWFNHSPKERASSDVNIPISLGIDPKSSLSSSIVEKEKSFGNSQREKRLIKTYAHTHIMFKHSPNLTKLIAVNRPISVGIDPERLLWP